MLYFYYIGNRFIDISTLLSTHILFMTHNLIQYKQTQKKELIFVSAMRQVVWARESEVGNEVQGLLNPLFVRPSASWPYPRSVRSYPLVRSSARLPVRPSASILRAICPSAPRLPARPSPPLSASSKNYLSFSSARKFFTSCTPREIAT